MKNFKRQVAIATATLVTVFAHASFGLMQTGPTLNGPQIQQRSNYPRSEIQPITNTSDVFNSASFPGHKSSTPTARSQYDASSNQPHQIKTQFNPSGANKINGTRIGYEPSVNGVQKSYQNIQGILSPRSSNLSKPSAKLESTKISVTPGSPFKPKPPFHSTATQPANKPISPQDAKPPGETVGPTNYQMAGQPKQGDHWKQDAPKLDSRAARVPHSHHDFSPTPIDPTMPYDPWEQMNVYQGKTLNANQRPLLEIGRPWYQLGELSPGNTWFGAANLSSPQFLLFGDMRTAVANFRQGGNDQSIWAFQANLNFDLKITATERFHMFMGPLDRAGNASRFVMDNGVNYISELDPDVDFGFFEGDLGAIVGGMTGQTLPFDLPFAVGVMPLLFQNGVWMEDAILGAAFTIPAQNSAKFDISNMDTTFFAGFDKIDSPAFEGDDNTARMYGIAQFIEARNGYFEIDYAYLEDRAFRDRSYHNIGIGFTRRYGKLLSNSVRLITNAGQSTRNGPNTADGFVFLLENSLITKNPSTFIPYANFWVGIDRPQSAARQGAAGGILRNTGILFESDNITGFPTLDASANDTYGGAIGLNIIKSDFSQQLVLEAAMLEVIGSDPNRNASGRQYGFGARYQLPLSNAVILRADGMVGFLENANNVSGLRLELRHKF